MPYAKDNGESAAQPEKRVLEIFSELAIVLTFSAFSGAGLYDLLAPQSFRRPYLAVTLVPALGLALLSICGGYAVAFSQPVWVALYFAAAIGGGLTLFRLLATTVWTSGTDGRRRLRIVRLLDPLARIRAAAAAASQLWAVESGVFVLLLLVLLAPVLNANMATTPYRIGIDQAGYGEVAQYLVEGGTTDRLRVELARTLGTTDVAKAIAQNSHALDFGRNVDAEFLLKALRWGYPSTVAALTMLTRAEHAYRVEYVILVFSYALVGALIFGFVRRAFGLSRPLAMATAAAVLLNCNLLNTLFEGQFPEAFVLGYYTLLFVLIAEARSTADGALTETLRVLDFWRVVLLGAVAFAALMMDYNESIPLLLLLLFGIVVLDLGFYRGTSRIALAAQGITLSAGALIALPESVRWLRYTFANIANISNAGYYQPHWATFPEILGLLDIYRNTGYELLPRTPTEVLVNVALTAFLGVIFLTFVFAPLRYDRSLLVAPVVGVIAVYVKLHLVDDIPNYPYMKVYTLLTPLLVVAAIGSLAWWGAIYRRFNWCPAALAAVVCVTGLEYCHQYLLEYHYVDGDMMALYTHDGGVRRLDQYAVVTKGSDIKTFMLTSLMAMRWVNEDYSPKILGPYADRRIALVVNNNNLTCHSCFSAEHGGAIIYDSPSWVVIDAGMTVRQLCPEGPKYTLQDLGYGLHDGWVGLPPTQCDFSPLLRLRFLI